MMQETSRTDTRNVTNRNAVRAILLSPEPEILLLRIHPPEGGDTFWITPGGGLEPEETVETGLRRELMEELRISDFVVGPRVWLRQHTFNWGTKRVCQREEYYIVHVARFSPRMYDLLEANFLDQFRWWHATELRQIPEHSHLSPWPISLNDISKRAHHVRNWSGRSLLIEH